MHDQPPNHHHRLRPSLVLAAMLLLACRPAAGAATTESAGDLLAGLVPAAAFAATWQHHDPAGRRQFLIGLVTSGATATALKAVIHRPRPDGSGNDGFPSRHAAVAFQGAAFLDQRYGPAWGIPAYLAAGFVGYSRLQSHRHSVGDVAGGALLGWLTGRLLTTTHASALTLVPVVDRHGAALFLHLRH